MVDDCAAVNDHHYICLGFIFVTLLSGAVGAPVGLTLLGLIGLVAAAITAGKDEV